MKDWAINQITQMLTDRCDGPLTDYEIPRIKALLRLYEDEDELEYELAIAIADNNQRRIDAMKAAIRERDLAGAGVTR